MCTLSWIHYRDRHYEVYFNRDEQRTRLPALEAQSVLIDGVHCVMPIDPVGGGSWISTNEYGVTVCLLNFYQGHTPQGELTSRGMIVKALASSDSNQSVDQRLLTMDLSSFAPFTLVSFDVQHMAQQARLWTWDGELLRRSYAVAPIISAAVDFEQARQYRQQLFNELIVTQPIEKIGCQFHQTHDENYPHLSPLMARKDARTVSFTKVVVSANQPEMLYQSIDQQRHVDFSTRLNCLIANE